MILSNSSVPSIELLAWLNSDTSLTQLAREKFDKVELKLINYQWLYSRRGNKKIYLREIVMFCKNQPWWYARTYIPYKTYQKKHEIFCQLGDKAIGDFLFHCTSVKRIKLYYKQITPDSLLFQNAIKAVNMPPANLWARFSTFMVERRPLYINEVFLPSMLKFYD